MDAKVFFEVLTDDSKVYGVRVFCDYDDERVVEFDCEDEAQATELAHQINTLAMGVEVKA